METKAITLSKFAVALLVSLTILGLLFRATIYWLIPVSSEEPAGFGDVIELVIYFAIVGSAGIVLVLSIVVAFYRKYSVALKTSAVGVLAPIAYYFLHSMVPKLV